MRKAILIPLVIAIIVGTYFGLKDSNPNKISKECAREIVTLTRHYDDSLMKALGKEAYEQKRDSLWNLESFDRRVNAIRIKHGFKPKVDS